MKTSLLSALIVALMVAKAQAVVLHDDDMPADRPPEAAVGRWNSNASCVAVGREWVITTGHQGGSVGSIVTLAGVSYVVSEIHDSDYDFRLARIRHLDGRSACLTEYADLSFESATLPGQECILGGYGKGRGTPVVGKRRVVCGYSWAGSSNTVLRWGTNTIDFVLGNFLHADFDAADAADATSHEAALASWDSGGGWFVRDAETERWQVVGLAAGVSRSDESRFSPPDRIYAVRTSLCAGWAQTIIDNAEPLSLSVLADLDRDWVYQNATATTGGRHKVVLALLVEDDPYGNSTYQVIVTQVGGPGAVTIESTDDPLVWLIGGGNVNTEAPGDVVLAISVEGIECGGTGSAECLLTVRLLGDIDGNGVAEPDDLSLLTNALNGTPDPALDPAAFDLDADGAIQPSDVLPMVSILNGQPVP